jgi:transposase
MAASVSKSSEPDYFRCHTSECTRITPEPLNQRDALAAISPKAGRKDHIRCDFAMYRSRRLVENFFCNLKRIATRYDKTDKSFAAMIYHRQHRPVAQVIVHRP